MAREESNNAHGAGGERRHHNHQLLLDEKAKEIEAVLNEPHVDLWKLRALAISEGGLVNDSIRRRAWPKLVGLERLWDDPTGKQQHVAFQSPSSKEEQKTDEGSPNKKTPKKSNTSSSNHPSILRNKTNQNNKKKKQGSSSRLQQRPPRGPPPSSNNDHHHQHHPSLGGDTSSVSSSNSIRDKILASCLDATQIELDVTRCTWHLLTGTQRSQRLQMEHKRNKKISKLIKRKQRRLANLINLTLVQSYKRFSGSYNSRREVETDNTLRYYQGYHDVACIILNTLSGSAPIRLRPSISEQLHKLEHVASATGLDMPAAILLQISQSHFRDCMRATFLQLQTAIRLTLFPLIALFDRQLHEFLMDCDMEPFFALSWVITWFSHEIRDTDLTKRLFDFFMVSHPLMPIYLSVAMVCHPLNRQELLQLECDFSVVHQALAALPRNSSMVGWKYRPGDGYVSDDEEDDMMDSGGDDASSVGFSQGSVDTEFLLHEEALQSIHSDEGVKVAEAVSTVSSSLSSLFEARVPFQELIEMAIGYMERMPPRNLRKLATRYYGRDMVQSMEAEAPGISFLEPPPVWTRMSVAKSDKVLKYEDRCRRRSLSPARPVAGRLPDNNEDTPDLKELLGKERSKSLAVIAAGFGPGDDAKRRRRRLRKMMMAGAVAAAVVAIVAAFVMPSSQSGSKESTTHDVCPAEGVAAGRCVNNMVPEASSSQVIVQVTPSSLPPSPLDFDNSAVTDIPVMSPQGTPPEEEEEEVKRQPYPIEIKPSVVHISKKSAELDAEGRNLVIARNKVQLNVIVVLVVKHMFRELMLFGGRMGNAGKAILSPFFALTHAPQRVPGVARRSQGSSRENARSADEKTETNAFFARLLLSGFEQTTASLKETVDGVASPYLHSLRRRTSRAMHGVQDAFATVANDFEESKALTDSQSLANSRLKALEEEFNLSNVRKLALPMFTKLSELNQKPPPLHKVIRGATILGHYSPVKSKQMVVSKKRRASN